MPAKVARVGKCRCVHRKSEPSSGPVPTGSATLSDVTNGAKIYGTPPLKNGVGVLLNSTIPVGSYNLIATYGVTLEAAITTRHPTAFLLRIVMR